MSIRYFQESRHFHFAMNSDEAYLSNKLETWNSLVNRDVQIIGRWLSALYTSPVKSINHHVAITFNLLSPFTKIRDWKSSRKIGNYRWWRFDLMSQSMENLFSLSPVFACWRFLQWWITHRMTLWIPAEERIERKFRNSKATWTCNRLSARTMPQLGTRVLFSFQLFFWLVDKLTSK